MSIKRNKYIPWLMSPMNLILLWFALGLWFFILFSLGSLDCFCTGRLWFLLDVLTPFCGSLWSSQSCLHTSSRFSEFKELSLVSCVLDVFFQAFTSNTDIEDFQLWELYLLFLFLEFLLHLGQFLSIQKCWTHFPALFMFLPACQSYSQQTLWNSTTSFYKLRFVLCALAVKIHE